VVVVEKSKAGWLVTGVVPGASADVEEAEPDATALVAIDHAVAERGGECWRRSGGLLWPMKLAASLLAGRWLIDRGIEAHVIHSASRCRVSERKAGDRRIVWLRRC